MNKTDIYQRLLLTNTVSENGCCKLIIILSIIQSGEMIDL